MLKRLLIAVFVFSLIMALSGSAFSEGINSEKRTPIQKYDTENPRFNTAMDARPVKTAARLTISETQRVPLEDRYSPGPPLDTYCDYVFDYGDIAWFWEIPGPNGFDLVNHRFTVDPNYECTLLSAWLQIYGGAGTGNPDMRVYLWDDDGFGYPGNKIDSFDVLDPNSYGNAYHGGVFPNAPAGGYVFADGEDYHIGYHMIANDPADQLPALTDNGDGPKAGQNRSSVLYAGDFYGMSELYGTDYAFVIEAEVCCGELPFTECGYQSYWQSINKAYSVPHTTWADDAFAMRYDAGPGFDTIQFVEFMTYDDGEGTFGDVDLILTIYGDDAGLPDETNMIDQKIIPAGTYAPMPSWTVVPWGLVVTENFHIAFSTSGDFNAGTYGRILSDDGAVGAGRSTSRWDDGNWYTMAAGWGSDDNFLIDPYMCTDQYPLCDQVDYSGGAAWVWTFPDRFGRTIGAVKQGSVGKECRVQEVGWTFYSSADPLLFSLPTDISVYSDASGIPGSALATITINPGDYVYYPGRQVVDFTPLDVYVPGGDYWIAMEPHQPNGTFDDTLTAVQILSDGNAAPMGEHSWRFHGNTDGLWHSLLEWYAEDMNFLAHSTHCCIPSDEAPCDPDNDAGWATYQGNLGRTGASELAIGDAWCDLNLNWSYDGAPQNLGSGPVIYNDMVACAFKNNIVVLDLITGAVQYQLTTAFNDGQTIGNSLVSYTPTIVKALIGGDSTDVMFIAGGSTWGIAAVEFNTGALIWGRTVLDPLFGGDPSNFFGNTSFCVFNTYTVADTFGVDHDIVIWATDDGAIVAAHMETGELYDGDGQWEVNPVYMTGSPFASGATDGENTVFFSTWNTLASEGDVYSVNATTGAINWQLSSSGGLEAVNLFPDTLNTYPEGFRGGMALDDGRLYLVSYANDSYKNSSPADGVYYTLEAATGAHAIPAKATNRSWLSTPIIDQNRVLLLSNSQWASPPAGGNLISMARHTASKEWAVTGPDGGKYFTNGFRTCEPLGVDDLLFTFNGNGFLECWNSVNGDQIFRRRVTHAGDNAGLSGAIAEGSDGIHIVFTDLSGGLYDLKEGLDPRARLEIQTYNPTAPVEFGNDPNFEVNFGPMIVNTGCADLVISDVLVDEAKITGSSIPDFVAGPSNDEVMERASMIADDMQRNSFLSKFRQPDKSLMNIDGFIPSYEEEAIDKSYSSSMSAGAPVWLISVDQPYVGQTIAAGDTMDLVMTVNQPYFYRGAFQTYLAVGSNDTDFFLNYQDDAQGLIPEVLVTIVGGCLLDYTELHFGVGAANLQLITNTGRLGDGDWSPHAFEIDGNSAAYYQGAYIYGVSHYRLATNMKDLTGATGPEGAFTSLQADPDHCDDICVPLITSSVAVGAITTDGITYDPLTADMVCRTYIDSVENFDTDADPLVLDWAWDAFDIRDFDDTLTIGLSVDSRVFGVSDHPMFNNFTLDIMTVSERYGNAVPDWYLGSFTDYDVGGDDGAYDKSISTAWAYNPGGDGAWGSIKIPFGCGTVGQGQDHDFVPMRAAHGLIGPQAMYDVDAYMDSAYLWLSMPADTAYTTQPTQDGDFEFHMSFAAHDFAGFGSYSLGVAQFGLSGLSANSSSAELEGMANLINQWAGFGRGDVNASGSINLLDIIYLAAHINNGGPGPIPFMHIGDVNADGSVDMSDVNYLIDYYFYCGPCPMGDWVF